MANPESFGTWLNATQEVAENLPKLPQFIEDARNAINSVLDFLLALLDLALAFLQVIRAFAIGLLDPITALIEALLAEIEAFINDLRNLGIYIVGDWYLIEPPYSDLLGGYDAYEQRMIRRFVDRTDPTRPVLSPATTVFGAFFYVSVNFDAIQRLIRFLSLIVRFFNFDLRSTKTTLTPTDLRVQYGFLDTNFLLTRSTARQLAESTSLPDVAHVTWGLSSPVLRTPTLPFPVPPPAGFLVEVSTVRDGLPVYFDRPLANADRVLNGRDRVQEREQGRVLTPEGRPLVLYGGLDQIQVDRGFSYNTAMEDADKVKNGSARVFAVRAANDNVPIPPDILVAPDGRPLLQRTFFVSTQQLFAPNGTINLSPNFFRNARYSIDLVRSDMPFEADFEIGGDGQVSVIESTIRQPDNFFVRVAAVSDNVDNAQAFTLVIDGVDGDVRGNPVRARYGVGPEGQLSRADKGDSSSAIEINFPSSTSNAFLELVTLSLLVLTLSRSDLEANPTASFEDGQARTPTGLERFGPLVADIVSSINPSDFFSSADEDAEVDDIRDFRQTILDECRRVASDIYQHLGANPQLEGIALQQASVLTTFTFDQGGVNGYNLTIFEALEDDEFGVGIARNPLSTGIQLERGILEKRTPPTAVVGARAPGYHERQEPFGDGFVTVGSADFSPVIVAPESGGNRDILYLRNVFPDFIYGAASTVLGLASAPILKAPGEGEWISYRLGQLIPPLDGFLDEILQFARELLRGGQGIIDAILDYIDFLESRILELQALLNRIRALINLIIQFQLPNFAALFLLASGTDELLSQFIAADNKPVDGPTSYGGGAVIVGAGPPSFVVDLFIELFSTEDTS